MTLVDFINRKNKILFDKTGYILVPEDQIKECKQVLLNFYDDAAMCPYCQVFYKQDIFFSTGDDILACDGCPMNDARNNCNMSNSTYKTVIYNLYSIKEYIQIHYIPEIIDLVYQYNKELQEINASS